MAASGQGVRLEAMRRLRPGWVLLQLVGNAFLALGAMAWLHIPDSHGWQFALSVICGLLLVAALVWIYEKTIKAARQASADTPFWMSGAWLLAAFVIVLLWMHAVGTLNNNVELRAGYWNSQMSAHMRTVLTYPRLIEYQNAAIVALSWLLPVLILPIVVEIVARGWSGAVMRAAARVWLRWQFWLVAIIALFASCGLTSMLVDWHPSDSVRGEVVSVILRLALAYGVDILLGCVVLAVTCELLAQASAREGSQRNAAA
jgi:hypothetical protein